MKREVFEARSAEMRRKNGATPQDDGGRKCIQCKEYRPTSEFRVRERAGRKYFESRCDRCRKACGAARNHNITPERYAKLIADANGKCPLCFAETTKLHLDHCHTTGRIRGVLCSRCNTTLAHFNEDPELLRRMACYVEFWSGIPVPEEDMAEGLERERRMREIRERSIQRHGNGPTRSSSSEPPSLS